MPAGDLLQRVLSPAAASSSSSNSNNGENKVAALQSDKKSSPSVPVVDEDVAAAPRRQSSRDRELESGESAGGDSGTAALTTMAKRTSSELERPSAEEQLDKAKKKLPNPINTSHLSAGQPVLSFTPATPISPLQASPSSSSTCNVKPAARKNNGNGNNCRDKETRFQKGSSFATAAISSSPPKLSSQTARDKNAENANNAEEDPSTSKEFPSGSSPEGQSRQPILKQEQSAADTGTAQGEQQQELGDKEDGTVVQEEPEEMNEEDEKRLMESQKLQRRGQATSALSSSPDTMETSRDLPNDSMSPRQSDDHSQKQRQESGDNSNNETRAKNASTGVSFGQRDKGMSSDEQGFGHAEEDHPAMLPPRQPQSAAAAPPRQFALPKPSMLQRLPSQVISESPGSEYAPTPSTSGKLSRQSSLKRGDTGGSSSFADQLDSAGFALAGKQRGESKSDDVDDDNENKGGQSHLPSMLASAVQSLDFKLNRAQTDYGFPTQALRDAPPETIEEEGSPPPLPRVDSPISEKDNPLHSSPPASTFLDPSSSHSNRFARESPTSSIQSGSSVNEHSTPAGFMKHRRNSSQNAPREVKETTNAGYKDLPDGKRKLNNYILTSDIGRGSFGLVQIAKDEETGQEFAAKEFSKMRLKKRQQSEMIRRQAKGSRRGAVPMRGRAAGLERKSPDQGDPSKNDLDLIRSEVAIMKKLDHPNVVRLYEVLDVQQDDSLFMIVELCRNGPIMSVSMGQTTEPLSEDTARNFFRQMILAIEYLHENGIIHRDIKPENILKMSDDQSIKLVDFGVSEMFSKEDEERELRTGGSPAFMAPELCMSGHAKVSGKATDIWALGVTLYCMVVGHLPFESHLLLDLYDKIKNDPVEIPENLSSDLKDLILRLLEKDRSKRVRMNELREHPWVTCAGRDPLPSTAQNVTSLEEITEDDLAKAIAVPSVSYIINAVRAASRWKRFTARRTQSDSAQSDVSTGSTDMSRSGSIDVTDALASASRHGSGAKESTSTNTPLSQSAVSPPDEKQESTTAKPVKRNSGVITGDAFSPQDFVATLMQKKANSQQGTGSRSTRDDGTTAEHRRTDSSSSKGATDSPTQTSGIEAARSFPQSAYLDKERRPGIIHADTVSPTSSSPAMKHFDSMVAFPEIDRALQHQEHMSMHGIDDSSVEVLRHYEDTTGHMLPRSAIEETVRSRKGSPMPPDRQTSKGPSPP